jgi:hypothetical protein
MMQGRDVNVEDLFKVIREVRLFDDDSTTSVNREAQVVYDKLDSLEWMLVDDMGELAEHPLVRFEEPIIQSLQKGKGE